MNEFATRSGLVRVPSGLFRALRAVADPDGGSEGPTRLRRVGAALGGEVTRELEAKVHSLHPGQTLGELDESEFWTILDRTADELEWGSLRFEAVHPGVGALVSADWVESDPSGGRSHPSCHLTTGLLSDLLSGILGEGVATLEVECRSRGDATCRFLVGGSAALEAVHDRMGEGAAWQRALEDLD